MKGKLLKAIQTEEWRTALQPFARVDVCQMPEYHVAYSTRIKGSAPVMWCYESGGQSFCYPFLLTPVLLDGKDTGYRDISSIYGYSGPLATTEDHAFLGKAWELFDEWAASRNVIAEFIRFSLYADNRAIAHKDTAVEVNRPSAVSHLPYSAADYMASLPKKARNMIRKARKEGLVSRELDLEEWLPAFRVLYETTMDRNDATSFFMYNNEYYDHLLSLPPGELRLFGVFHEEKLISAAMALVYGKGALYHLGASLNEYNSLGAGNLAMCQMGQSLTESGVVFLTVGGGRTTAEDDPLFRFKKNNALDVDSFYIGKRVVDQAGYKDIVKRWQDLYNTEVSAEKLIFYRD